MIILQIFGLIIGWFIVGWIINVVIYVDVPVEQRGHSKTAQSLHYILNFVTILSIIGLIFS